MKLRTAMKLALFVIPLMLSSQNTPGPVIGHLSINRSRIRAGERVETRFEAINRGRESIRVTSGAPGSICGHFRVRVSHNGIDLEIPPPLQGPEIMGSCLYGGQDIAPGKKFKESLWISDKGEFSRPGKYYIDVTYQLVYDKANTWSRPESPGARFHSHFEVTVEKPTK